MKDLSLNQQREAEKLKKTDPVKAAQLERLGMGFGGIHNFSYGLVISIYLKKTTRAGIAKVLFYSYEPVYLTCCVGFEEEEKYKIA